MGQQNKTVGHMNYSTTKADLVNKHEYLKTAFQILNKKMEAATKTLSEIDTFLEENPEDIDFKLRRYDVLEKQQSITNDLRYIFNQMEATKKAIDNLDVNKAHDAWLHTSENFAFDRRFRSVMSEYSSSLSTSPEINIGVDEPKQRSFPLVTDEQRRKWKEEADAWDE